MEASMFILFNMHAYVFPCLYVCVHVHACAHVSGAAFKHPHPHLPIHPPQGDSQITKL